MGKRKSRLGLPVIILDKIVENKCFAERQNRNQSTVRSNFSNYYDNKLTGDSDELHVIK